MPEMPAASLIPGPTHESPDRISVTGSRVPIIWQRGAVNALHREIQALGAQRVFVVSDPGLRACGHLEHLVRLLHRGGLVVRVFDETRENPRESDVRCATGIARQARPDVIVALGGGSAIDTAKGVNFVYTNGGRIHDYVGHGKARKPMLPMIAIPTTAGTGSEAQSYAIIADDDTHQKMACGDEKAQPALAILDAELLGTLPPRVRAVAAIDALSHAVESAASTRASDISRPLSRRAFDLIAGVIDTYVQQAAATDAASAMLLGAHLAGAAIENSMLGAAHSAANPLTARHDVTHGLAVGVMLPHVVEHNCATGANPYAALGLPPDELIALCRRLLHAAGLPSRLSALGVTPADLPQLAAMANQQWTAQFNPRKLDVPAFAALYHAAL